MERSIGSREIGSNHCLLGGSSSEFKSISIAERVVMGARGGGSFSSSLVRSMTGGRDEPAAFGRRGASLTLGDVLPMDRRGG